MKKEGWIERIAQPAFEDDPSYTKWEQENVLVRSWLLSSLIPPSVAPSCLWRLKDITDKAAMKYKECRNLAQV